MVFEMKILMMLRNRLYYLKSKNKNENKSSFKCSFFLLHNILEKVNGLVHFKNAQLVSDK
jgi:hypothetical protein